MDLGSIFLLLALALMVVIFISRPFMNRKLTGAHLVASKDRKATDGAEIRHSSLLAERERLLSALQELDFDFTLGKIPAGEYPEQRAQLLSAGAAVLRELDEMDSPTTSENLETTESHSSLAGQKKPSPKGEVDELEELIAARRGQRSEKSAGFCPRCGKPVQASDEFCPKCGKKL